MDIIDGFYTNMNIYYSLVLYDDIIPEELVKELELADYPVVVVNKINDIEILEMNHRMFVLNINMMKELLHMKNNSLHEYSVIFCINDLSFLKTNNIMLENKPISYEKIYITKIYI